MRRTGALVCVLAGLALPAVSQADTPGYTAIGPPASLNSVAFAADGTIYGSTQWYQPASTTNPVVLWRSADHGRTWREVYRRPFGWTLQVIAVSSADRDSVYAYEERPRDDRGSLVRIDARTGRSVPLALGGLDGIDAAGTAYGREQDERTRKWWLVRCPRRADACTRVPMPNGLCCAVVDPNSVGLVVSPAALTVSAETTLLISRDGGASWSPGGTFTCCNLQFGGPRRETLYSRTATALAVSHDAGLTWGAPRPIPAAALAVGDHPTAVFGLITPTSPLLVSGDDGASARAIATPVGGQVVVDPSNPARMVIIVGDDTRITDDGGATWRELADRKFGVTALDYRDTAGSGRFIYSVGRESIVASSDLGATWTRVPRPAGESESRFVVSRDDPRTTYLTTQISDGAGSSTYGALRTRDGGTTWEPFSLSGGGAVSWIAPGDPLHVFALGFAVVGESRDGGTTWTAPAPQQNWCILEVVPGAVDPSREQLRCRGFYDPLDPLRPLPTPVPFVPGLVTSPDAPGVYAVVQSRNGAVIGSQPPLLGEFRSDWSWTSLLAPTGAFGPVTETSDAVAAWPSPAGTVFYAYDAKTRSTWVRRSAGRWWRLRVAGTDVTVFSALDATHALVAFPGQFSERGVVDLAQPPLAQPTVTRSPGGFACGVPWTAADAETTGYAWLRDGAPIPGANGVTYAASDAGEELACRVTGRTDFGASAVTSEAFARREAAVARLAIPKARGGHAVTVKVTPVKAKLKP